MLPGTIYMYILITRRVQVDRNAANINHIIYFGNTLLSMLISTVQITFIFICQTNLVFGKCVCTCVRKHSNVFRTSLKFLSVSVWWV